MQLHSAGHGRPARIDPLNTLDKAYRHRVAAATMVAQARPSHKFYSMDTLRVGDALALAVDCDARYRGEQTPRRFTHGDLLVEIPAVVVQ